MANRVKHITQNPADASVFVGLKGELVVEDENFRLRVHDSATPGGFPLLTQEVADSLYVNSADNEAFTDEITALVAELTTVSTTQTAALAAKVRVHDTVALMKAFVPSPADVGQLVYLRGYWAADDDSDSFLRCVGTTPIDGDHPLDDGLIFASDTANFWYVRVLTTGPLNVRQFGVKSDNTDSSVRGQACADLGRSLYFPPGDYSLNIELPERVRIFGDGAASTVIRPFDTAVAAFTLMNQSLEWSPSYVIEGLQFEGVAPATGIGITYSKTDPADYVAGDENVGRVTVRNCRFYHLNKGIQRPFGNIGLWIYNTCWASCKYATYNLDNKFGGVMHAGNFGVWGGESGLATHYFHNATDGFGDINFFGHIFEQSGVGLYVRNESNPLNTPIIVDGMWNEGNGLLTGDTTTVLDTWTGTTLGTASVPSAAIITSGACVSARLIGFAAGIYHGAVSGNVTVCSGSRVETDAGVQGQAFFTANPETANIFFEDYVTAAGSPTAPGCMVLGVPSQNLGNLTPSNTHAEAVCIVPPRWAAQSGLNLTKLAMPFTGSVGVSAGEAFSGTLGSFSADVVADGQLYATCNEFTLTLTDAQVSRCDTTALALSAGYWVHFVSLKSSGTIAATVWDRAAHKLMSFRTTSDSRWHTYAGITKITDTPTVFLDFTDTQGAPCTLRLSAFNICKFNTLSEAQEFLRSKIYAS